MLRKIFQGCFLMSSSFSIALLGFLMMTNCATVDARYRKHVDANIPGLLNKVYEEVGHDKFRESWKEFNSRNSDQQDDFLMADLSEDELAQLTVDFEHLGGILSTNPNLMELYAQFEHNLNTQAFNEMDRTLSTEHTWWGRIKKFLYKKLEKLADEIGRRELIKNAV